MKFQSQKLSKLTLKLGICFMTAGAANSAAETADPRPTPPVTIVADRVVVAVNNIPYTQTQVESYLNVKESLRDNAESSQVVKESNWPIALDAFINDMMIHQEATKSSGFRPTKETIQKLRARTEKVTSAAPHFKVAFERLNLSRLRVESEILKIATVENYRKGKASLNGSSNKGQNDWEAELKSRTIVRLFEQAKTWVNIQPRL